MDCCIEALAENLYCREARIGRTESHDISHDKPIILQCRANLEIGVVRSRNDDEDQGAVLGGLGQRFKAVGGLKS